MEEKTWYKKMGFRRNPFSSEPLTKEEAMSKAFVDRKVARKDIENFVQEKSGSIIIISEIGHGKSSMINFAEKTSENVGKSVLRINPRTNEEKICFFQSLSKEVIKKISKLQEEQKDILEDFISKGDEYNLQILIETLKEIFSKNPSVLIMDDLDKILDFKNHIYFIKEIIDLLPRNLQIVTTGEINQIRGSSQVVSVLYELFDFPIVLEEINTIKQLKEFVYGRMGAYAEHGSGLKFDNEIFDLLLDRTRGNLREVFRYLSELLKLGKYSSNDLIRTIIKVDMVRLQSLDEVDKKILSFISGESKNIQEIKSHLLEQKVKLTLPTIRGRLDELHQNCWSYKDKAKDNKKIIYSAPAMFKSMVEYIRKRNIII